MLAARTHTVDSDVGSAAAAPKQGHHISLINAVLAHLFIFKLVVIKFKTNLIVHLINMFYNIITWIASI